MEAELQRKLDEARVYAENSKTIGDVKRAIAMITEAYQQYADRLRELIEEVSPDYVPMEEP